MFEEIRDIIVDVVSLPASDVHPDSNLVEDLGLDSLDAMEMTVQLEKRYNVKIKDADVMRLKTVQDIVDHLQALRG